MANKTDLINEVHTLVTSDQIDVKISKKDLTKVVDAVLDTIIGLTGEAGKLQLIGFGNFTVKERAARKGRNPQTGDEIEIPASKNIGFKAGKSFKEFVK